MAQPSDPIQAPHKKATEERACVAWILILTLTVDLYSTSPAMLPFPHAVPHSGRDHRSRASHRSSAFPHVRDRQTGRRKDRNG